MSFAGVLVNVATVLIGGLFGLLFKKAIPQRVTTAVMIGLGLCTLYIGIDGSMACHNILIVIAAMVLGGITGTALNIDGQINRLGDAVAARFRKQEGQTTIAEGFVTASLLYCIGAMTITGSLNAGMSGDNSLLYTKSLLDLFSSIMLAASLGVGVLCSAVFVLVFQGGLVLLAGVLAPVLTEAAIGDMTCAGSLMIIALGLNLIGVTKLKVADYLPAIVYAPLLCWIVSLPVWQNLLHIFTKS